MRADFKSVRNIMFGALLASTWSIAPAQQSTEPGGTSAKGSSASNTLDRNDKQFIEKAAKDGMAEVELGRLAQSKASSDQVKQFAKHMEQDHSMANDQLMQIAQSKGVSVPQAPDRSQSKKAEKLGKESGADFDKKYMAEMVKDHEKALKLFRQEAQNAKDPELKSFAQQTAQKISEHLSMAKQIAGQVGADSGRGSTHAGKSGANPDHRPNAESSRADAGAPDTTANRDAK